MVIPVDRSGIRIVVVGKTGSGTTSMCNKILGVQKFDTDCSKRNIEPWFDIDCPKRNIDALRSYSRSETGNRAGTCITVVDTPGIRDMSDIRETNRKIETEVSFQQYSAVFYTVNQKMTGTDKKFFERTVQNMNSITRRKTFLVLQDFQDTKEKNTYTRLKVPVLRISSKLQDNEESELQIKTIIKKIQLRNHLVKRYPEVVIIPVSHSTKFVLILILILLQIAKANNTDNIQVIQWKLMTKPVYFGGNVELECIIKTDDTSAPMSWTKIPSGETIAYNKVPADKGKYSISAEHDETSMVYNLTIKEFNSTDVNRIYRCDHGFDSYEDKLLLNEHDFIARPSKKDVTHNFSVVDRKLLGKVKISNGYPKPVCSGIFEGSNIAQSMEKRDKKVSIFFETSIELTYSTDICRGFVNMTCVYGNVELQINQRVDACSDSSNSISKDVPIIIGVSLGVIFVVAVIWLMKNKLKKLLKKACFSDQDIYEQSPDVQRNANGEDSLSMLPNY